MLNKPLKSMALVSAAALLASLMPCTAANAATFTIRAYDDIYGPYFGEVTGDINAPSSFEWRSAGYHWSGNIALTNSGNVIANIVTNYDDIYTLYTGDNTIGLPSTASASLEIAYGQTVSLYSTISSLNGGQGICCDNNGWTPQIKFGPAAPSPLAGGGLLSALAVLAALSFTRFRRGAGALS